jgi:hypothetical protein
MYTLPSKFKQNFLASNHDNIDEKMYTDAFKSLHGVGAAVIWKNIVHMYKLPSSCSIYTAESYAILKEIHLIHEHNIPNTTIYLDSLSAIK